MLRAPVLLLTGFLLTLSSSGFSSEPTPDKTRERRRLGNHIFTPSDILLEPFATSYAQMATGGGTSKATVAGNDYNLAAFFLSFEGQAAINHWFALGFSFLGAAVVGTDIDSALTAGANGQFTGSVRALAEFLRSESISSALVVTAGQGPSYQISPEAALTNQQDILAKKTESSIVPELRFAWGLSPTIGLLSSLSYDYTSSNPKDGPTEKEKAAAGSIGVSCDLAPATPLPISLLASLGRSLGIGRNNEKRTNFGFGVFTSGQLDFSIGTELFISHSRDIVETVPIKQNSVLGKVGMRYYW